MPRLLLVLLAALCALSAGSALATSPHSSVPSVVPTYGQIPEPLAPMLFGTGTDGQRIQAIYVYSSYYGNRLDRPWSEVSVYTQPQPPAGTTVRQVIERDAGYVDAAYLASAQYHSPASFRRVRWVTDPTGRIDILPVSEQAFPAALPDRPDHVYLAWGESSFEGMCGGRAPGCAGGYSGSDLFGIDNPNDVGGSTRLSVYGGGDAWNFPAPYAHELTHELGSVQWSAPYVSTDGHVCARWDLMEMHSPDTCPHGIASCTTDTWDTWWLLDACGDEYFNPSPAAGNYLATHWNVANSVFLATASAGTLPSPSPSPSPQPQPSPTSCVLRDTLPEPTPSFRFCANMEIPYSTFTNLRTQFMLLCPALVYDSPCGQSWSIQYVQAGRQFTELGYTFRDSVRWAYVDGGINQYGGHDYGWLEG